MDPGGRSGDQALPSSGLSSHLEMGHISVQERDAVDGDGRLSCHCLGRVGTLPPLPTWKPHGDRAGTHQTAGPLNTPHTWLWANPGLCDRRDHAPLCKLAVRTE